MSRTPSSTSLACPACGSRFDDPDLRFCPHDGRPLVARGSPARALQPGEIVADRFRVISSLGSGGMGAVYRAEHVVMRREVALKILRPEVASDPVMVARFEREARAATRIACPEVVAIHDFGKASDGLSYMAMELVEGEVLSARIDRDGALPPREAVRIATAIARSLRAAHEVGVVHRDLKPENVMVLPDGGVRVLDFGIARILEDPEPEASSTPLTQAGSIVGTPRYMSPEAAARSAVGPPGDIYGLGVILFELLVGRSPFDEPEMVLLLGMHLRAPPELVREARPGLVVPDELEALVDRMLAKKASARPEAAEVLAELERIAREELAAETSGAARPAPRATPSMLPANETRHGRGPWPLLAGGAVIATLAVIAIVVAMDPGAPAPATHRIDAPASAPFPDAGPALVEVRFAVRPSDARLRWDGEIVEGSVVRVAQDGATHRLLVEADGFVPLEREIVADRSREIDVELAQVAATPEPAARPHPTGPCIADPLADLPLEHPGER